MKSPKSVLTKRGFVDDEFIAKFSSKTSQELIALLASDLPQARTSAAKLLGDKKAEKAVEPLCKALSKEDKIYSKIAISEALASIGEPSVPSLIKLLGRIGNNQYKKLPSKLFAKKNYPLPRDIVARTIIRIGESALPYLEEVLKNGHMSQVSEALDAIGYIAFYTKNLRSLNALQKCLDKYKSNDLVVWKIVRAFESFPTDEVVRYLEGVKRESPANALRQKAGRSLRQIGYF